MNQEMVKYFGEPISVYTQEQALEDGVLMKNPSETFDECDILTTHLWHYIEKKCRETTLTKPIELLEIVMKKAKHIYDKCKFVGDNDRNFFVIKGNGYFNSVWFVRNGYNKLTGMLPEDY